MGNELVGGKSSEDQVDSTLPPVGSEGNAGFTEFADGSSFSPVLLVQSHQVGSLNRTSFVLPQVSCLWRSSSRVRRATPPSSACCSATPAVLDSSKPATSTRPCKTHFLPVAVGVGGFQLPSAVRGQLETHCNGGLFPAGCLERSGTLLNLFVTWGWPCVPGCAAHTCFRLCLCLLSASLGDSDGASTLHLGADP